MVILARFCRYYMHYQILDNNLSRVIKPLKVIYYIFYNVLLRLAAYNNFWFGLLHWLFRVRSVFQTPPRVQTLLGWIIIIKIMSNFCNSGNSNFAVFLKTGRGIDFIHSLEVSKCESKFRYFIEFNIVAIISNNNDNQCRKFENE